MIAGERVLGQKKLVLGQCDDRELSVDQAEAAGLELEFQLVIRMLFCFCFGSRWWGWGLDVWRIQKWCRVGRRASGRKIKTILLKPFVLTSSGVLGVQGGVGTFLFFYRIQFNLR